MSLYRSQLRRNRTSRSTRRRPDGDGAVPVSSRAEADAELADDGALVAVPVRVEGKQEAVRARFAASVEIQKTGPGGHRRLTAQPGEIGNGTGRLRIGAK